MAKIGAGLIMYRMKGARPEVLLVHGGGPYFKNKDDGAWSIPKGLAENGETAEQLLEVAKREFEEETSFTPEGEFHYIGSVKRQDGKVVEAWAFEGDCDPTKIKSNTTTIEWPPRSGKQLEIPEVDRAAFFTLAEARRKLWPYQVSLIDQFEQWFKTI